MRRRSAALDALANEPLPDESPLWQLPNVLLSPHTAGRSERVDRRMVALFIEYLRRYLAGAGLFNRIPLPARSAASDGDTAE